jgi:hypothetical protein
MIHPAHQGNVQISDVDNVALCKEISERLINSLGPKPLEMPPHLMVLMRQLRDEPPKAVTNLLSKS